MKKGLVYVLAFIILTNLSLAVTVNLISPTNSQTITNTNNISFQCSVDLVDATLNKLELWTNISGTFTLADYTGSSTLQKTIYNVSNGTYYWNCKADTNQGIFWGISNYIFTVNYPVNSPPTCEIITGYTLNISEDGEFVLGLNSICSDPNGDTLTYNYSGFDNVDVDIENYVATMVPNLNWYGVTEGYLSADDGHNGKYTSPKITFNVAPVNDMPKLNYPIPNQTILRNQEKILNMKDFFGDVDNDTLTYNVSSLSHFTVSITGSNIGFTSIGEWGGNENCIITASDSLLIKQSNIFTLKVMYNGTSNNPPNISNPSYDPNVNLNIGDIIYLSATVYDSDGDNVTVHWYVNSNILLDQINNSYKFEAKEDGTYSVRMKADDGLSYSEYIWNVNVGNTNANPGLNEGSTTDIVNSQGNSGTDGVSGCGDGVCDETKENCSNCPLDCKVPSGMECKNGKLVSVKKTSNMLILLIGIVVFLVFAFLVIFLYKKKQEKKLFGDKKDGIVNVVRDKASSMIGLQKPPELKVVEQKKEEVHKPESFVKTEKVQAKKLTTSSNIILRDYIKKNMANGKSYDQIKKDLLKVGWRSEDIDLAYKDLK